MLVLAVLAAPAAAADNPWLAQRVLNIAHQGGEDEFPSNTLYAFKRSVKAGADMLELDVGVTKDGKVVVSHDTTLEPHDERQGHDRVAHAARRSAGSTAAYWFAKGDDAYRHDRKRSRLQAARDRHGQARAAGGLQALATSACRRSSRS